jgi:hypothetical protein
MPGTGPTKATEPRRASVGAGSSRQRECSVRPVYRLFLFYFLFYFSTGSEALSLFITDMGEVGKLDGSGNGSAPGGARGGLEGGGRGKEHSVDRPRDIE